jgi:hypothetical protein
MHRSLRLLILSAICFAGLTGKAICFAGSSENVPDNSTPQSLQEAWLRFHESDLCQEVDVVFMFDDRGMEAWSRIENEKTGQKYQELFGSLGDAVPVELYMTRPAAKKKSSDSDDPPPSLSQNMELRANLNDPIARLRTRVDESMAAALEPGLGTPDILLSQRLLVFAERTLDWNKKMEKYATELSSLARFALDPKVAPTLRSRSMRLCAEHTRNLEKQIGKLSANLVLAFPKPSKNDRADHPPKAPEIASLNLIDGAEKISAETREVARRVNNFIHPQGFSIELDELRHPSLLDSLKTLRTMVLDFQKVIAKRQ